MTEQAVRAHVFITGRVQGVFFRHATSQEATQRGVTGWVRNLPDERVEAVFEGSRGAVDEMVGWCKRGPQYAVVEDLVVTWEDVREESGFSIR